MVSVRSGAIRYVEVGIQRGMGILHMLCRLSLWGELTLDLSMITGNLGR